MSSLPYRSLRLGIVAAWFVAGIILAAYVSLFETWTGVRILFLVFYFGTDVPLLVLLRRIVTPSGPRRAPSENPLSALEDDDVPPQSNPPVPAAAPVPVRQPVEFAPPPMRPKERFIKVRYNADFFAKIRVEDSEVDETTVKLVRIEEDKPAEP